MKHKTLAGTSALLLFLAATAASGASAETDVYAGWMKPGPPPVERFVKPLGLTAEQQQKLRPIFAEAQAKAAQETAEQEKNKAPSTEIAGSALLTREADMRVRLATVLSPEQMARYEQLTAARAANARTLEPHPAHGHSEMDSPSRTLKEPEGQAPPAK